MTIVPTSGKRLDTRDRLDQQLSQLCLLRAAVSAEMIDHRCQGDLENNDAYHRSVADLEALDGQIARIHAALKTIDEPDVGDDTIRLGSVVTVEFDHDQTDRTRFLLGAHEQHELVDVEICSPDSPLGQAILGSVVGDERFFVLPTGRMCTVTVVDCVHHRW
ncbi:transcription elongation factor GreA [Williamsia limnetica]|uniref:Transcription elongation factor GreA n=1 Tax=Williamsia limnetica TaxID=882452 RepID=A0A318RLP9_WILLI|nr:GreA/GreB family elongation factor [Williamsia limnetica]PYE19243.1 transcription elongation factor GreA [Williamsia limnetica]